jgi:hypothetical protein
LLRSSTPLLMKMAFLVQQMFPETAHVHVAQVRNSSVATVLLNFLK